MQKRDRLIQVVCLAVMVCFITACSALQRNEESSAQNIPKSETTSAVEDSETRGLTGEPADTSISVQEGVESENLTLEDETSEIAHEPLQTSIESASETTISKDELDSEEPSDAILPEVPIEEDFDPKEITRESVVEETTRSSSEENYLKSTQDNPLESKPIFEPESESTTGLTENNSENETSEPEATVSTDENGDIVLPGLPF